MNVSEFFGSDAGRLQCEVDDIGEGLSIVGDAIAIGNGGGSVADDFAPDLCAAFGGDNGIFEYQNSGAFADHHPLAMGIERSARFLWGGAARGALFL